MPNPISTQSRQPIRIAIGNIVAEGAHPLVVRNIETVVIDNCGKHAELDVVSYKEIMDMLNLEERKQLAGCESNVSCLAEIGGAMGVDKLVTGSVGFLGDQYLISLQLIDIQKAKVESRSQARVKQGEEKEFLEATDRAARELIEPILWKEPSRPWRTFQVLKWSSAALALASLGLGTAKAFQSGSKENDYDNLFNGLVQNNSITQTTGGGYVFRDASRKSANQPKLDSLKQESRRDAVMANVALGSGGVLLAAAGLFFYLDHTKQKKEETETQADGLFPPKLDLAFSKTGAFASVGFSF